MITLHKYLYPASSGEAEQFCAALAGFASSLLEGVEAHVFRDPHPRLDVFRTEMRDLRERVESEPAPERLADAGVKATHLLEQYRATREEIAGGEAGEVQKIFAMLNQTVTVLSAGSDRSLARLRQIEDDLRQASMIGDIVALKARLSETMRYVREESVREREASARSIAEIRRDVQRAQEGIAIAQSGLPGRAEAEASLAAAMERHPRAAAVAVLLLERADTIQQRFGGALASRFVSLFVQDLSRALPTPKNMFRWSGSAILVELESGSAAPSLRHDLRKWLEGIPAERRLDVGQRLAVFSNAHRWTVFPLADVASVTDAVRRIEQFLRP